MDGDVFLPRPEARGEIARAWLYMAHAYPTRLVLDPKHRQLFERWSRDDPPDAWERERNGAIAQHQGNANPFIEGPSGALAEDAHDEPHAPDHGDRRARPADAP